MAVTTGADPLALLRRLRVALARTDHGLPAEVAEWLQAAIGAYVADGGRRPLDHHLGLRGRGRELLGTVCTRARRDAWLALALEYAHEGRPPPSREWSARHLVERARRFESRTWPRLRHLDAPPVHLAPLERVLFDGYREGHRVPATPAHILARVRR